MIRPPEGTDVAVRYLLGDLSEDDRRRFEAEFFARAEPLERLAAAEDRLIEDYLDGSLTEETRKRFEEKFLVLPGGTEKVEFARALRQVLSERGGAGVRPIRSYWLPAAAAVLLVIAAFLLFENSRLRSRLLDAASFQSQQTELLREVSKLRGENERSAAALDRERELRASIEARSADSRNRPARLASFVLVAGLTRESPSGRVFEVPRGTDRLRLTAPITGMEHESYEIVIRKPDGREVWRAEGLKSEGGTSDRKVVLELPADRLPAGDYILEVRGLATPGASGRPQEFFFRLITT